jgi:sporulation protein YlmC with PRC-barrel domain
MLVDHDGERIGKLHDVSVDVENGAPQFATVNEGFIGVCPPRRIILGKLI